MSAKGEKVAIHRLNIHLEMRCTLGSIHQYGDIVGVSYLDNLLNRINCSKYVAHMGHADDLGLLRDQPFQLIEAEQTIIGNRDMLHHNATLHGLKLPTDDVGMVLHLSDNDLIASLHLTLAERTSHKVNGLGSASCKNDLLNLAGIDKLTHFLASGLMQIGSLLREVMHPTMHIGIHIEVLIPHGVEHHERLLRGGRIVEIDQRFAIDLARQNREIGPYLFYIEH